jgi:hypothetical protein
LDPTTFQNKVTPLLIRAGIHDADRLLLQSIAR